MSLLDNTLTPAADGSSSTSSNLSALNLVLVQIDYSNVITRIWVNPDLAAFDYLNPPTPHASYAGLAPAFDKIAPYSRSPAMVDELRILRMGHQYDGSAKSVSAISTPAGLGVHLTYNGSTQAPSAAGTYTVVATVDDVNYSGGTTRTLVIEKEPASLTLGNLALAYNGSAQGATVTTTPAGLPVNLTYNGGAPPTDVGTYTVTATITHPGYEGSTTGTLVISQATATITLDQLTTRYVGRRRRASATTSPAGLVVDLRYDGSITPPTNAGEYAVVGTINSVNYNGSAAGTLVIQKADQTITFGSVNDTFFTDPAVPAGAEANGGLAPTFSIGSGPPRPGADVNVPVRLSATASSGLPVEFTLISGNATLMGAMLTLADWNPVIVRASQAGDSNHHSTKVEQTITARPKLTQTIAFTAPSDRRADDAAFEVNVTASSSLPVMLMVVNGPATLEDGRLALSGEPGVVVVRATQAGDDRYAAAPEVTRRFQVGPAGARVFFGKTANDDLIAASVTADNSGGTLIGYLAATREGFVTSFSLNLDGTFAATATTFSESAPLLTAINDHATDADPAPRTFRGQIVNGMLTGYIEELRLAFGASGEPVTGPTVSIAGYYHALTTNTASGGIHAVIGTGGDVYMLVVSPDRVEAASGELASNHTFSVSTTQGVAIAFTIDELTTTLTGTIGGPGEPSATFAGANGMTPRMDRLINLSSRARIGPATNHTLITGFVIGGTQPKRMLLRAVGPGLEAFRVDDAIPDLRLCLYDSEGGLVTDNDDWSGADLAASFPHVGAFGLNAGSRDAALLVTLVPGAYTMHVLDRGDSGLALAEIYDASTTPQGEDQRLINISSRGLVDAGVDVLIGGFVITGNQPKRVLVRGVGPALGAFGVVGALSDPRLVLYSGDTLIAHNEDWGSPIAVSATQTAATSAEIAAVARSVGAFAHAPGSKDAAILVRLGPGNYTAQISGANGTSGVALVEVYETPE